MFEVFCSTKLETGVFQSERMIFQTKKNLFSILFRASSVILYTEISNIFEGTKDFLEQLIRVE